MDNRRQIDRESDVERLAAERLARRLTEQGAKDAHQQPITLRDVLNWGTCDNDYVYMSIHGIDIGSEEVWE